jgi:plastocyanin
VIGAGTLLLVACGASDTISPSASTPTPAIEPNACSLISDADVAAALTAPPAAGASPAAAATPGQVVHLYSVTQISEGGTKIVGECTWRNDQGAQVIALVIPQADITKLADYTTGAQQVGGAYIQESTGRGFVAVQDGPGVVAITLVLDVDPGVRTQRLANLARAAVATAKIPVITAGPSAAASATPAGPVANGPGDKVTGQTAATKVQETDQLKFNPTSATVKAGQVVEWDNSGQVAHNVTFDEFPQITSDTMNGGDKYQVKFTKAGTYSYHCTFHPGMDAQITVQ